MKKLLLLLLILPYLAISQSADATPIENILLTNATEKSSATRVTVQDATTKELGFILKSTLNTNISIGNKNANTFQLLSSTGSGPVVPQATTTEAGLLNASDKVKLNSVATGATANSTDAQLRDRTTHTGVQAISTVTDLQTSLDGKQTKNRVNVKDFGALGFGIIDESLQIQNAIDAAGIGGIIDFNKGNYLIKNQLNLKDNQTIYGNSATLKRGNESKSTLLNDANSFSTSLSINAIPNDWKLGDEVHLYNGNGRLNTTTKRKITAINGNLITLDFRIGSFIEGPERDYNAGFNIRKVYNLIETRQYPTPGVAKILELNIDGNKANNTANYFWYFNTSINIFGFGSIIENCTFINIPNENIVGQGVKIVNNYARALNGSFFHLSSPAAVLGETFMGSSVIGNHAFETNILDPTLTGHSLAVIEQSWNAGKLIVSGNYFEGSGLAYCYDFTAQASEPYGDNERVIVTGNYFKNYSKISNDIGINQTWQMNKQSITSNVFDDCGTVNYGFLNTKDILFFGNKITGNTIINNLVINADNKYLFKKEAEIKGDSGAGVLQLTSASSSMLLAQIGSGFFIQNAVNNIPYFNINNTSNQGTFYQNINFLKQPTSVAAVNPSQLVIKSQVDLLLNDKIGGFGTVNKLSKFGGSKSIVDSNVTELPNGFVGINQPNPTANIDVVGNGKFSGTVSATSFNGSAALTGTPTAPTAATGTNTTQIATTAFVQAIKPYKIYVALLTQTGSSAPVATVLENTLGGTVVWTRSTAGVYAGTLSSAFTLNKTFVVTSQSVASYEDQIGASRFDSDIIAVTSWFGSTPFDGRIQSTSIEIRVYN
jgi:hypothetical protein